MHRQTLELVLAELRANQGQVTTSLDYHRTMIERMGPAIASDPFPAGPQDIEGCCDLSWTGHGRVANEMALNRMLYAALPPEKAATINTPYIRIEEIGGLMQSHQDAMLSSGISDMRNYLLLFYVYFQNTAPLEERLIAELDLAISTCEDLLAKGL